VIQMKFIDITVPISANVPIFPGDPKAEVELWKSIEAGDAANVSMLRFGAHTATHVDAPVHFITGASRIDQIPLDALVGNALVVEIAPDKESISAELLAGKLKAGVERILFKTRNSDFWSDTSKGFRTDFVYIEPDAASMLADKGIRLVGIDYLSVEKFHSGHYDTHLRLLSKGVVIIEGLDLREVTAGEYELICLPLKIAAGAGDGAPARAVLRTLE
jgi:arylformamidase